MGFFKSVIFFMVFTFTFFSEGQAHPSDTTVVLVSPYQQMTKAKGSYSQYFRQSYDLVLTDQESSPELSAGDIVKTLREAGQPVTLVCFGKAASDCLTALLLFSDLQPKVNQFVSLQGKVRGAEYSERLDPLLKTLDIEQAEKMPFVEAFRFIYYAFRQWFNAVPEGLYAMRPQARESFLQTHKEQIRELSRQVELVSIDTSTKKYGVLPYSGRKILSQNEKL